MQRQEREQLERFLDQLTQASAVQKDGEAEALIRAACARQPDAAYLLTQRAMLLDHALTDAQATITRLQSELIAAQSSGQTGTRGFLADTNAWVSAPGASPALARPVTSVAPPPAPTAAAPSSSWGGGFLGTMAATAAGVAAGSFLYQGLGQVFGNHHQGSVAGEHPNLANANGFKDDYDSAAISNSQALSGDLASANDLDNLGPSDDWS